MQSINEFMLLTDKLWKNVSGNEKLNKSGAEKQNQEVLIYIQEFGFCQDKII